MVRQVNRVITDKALATRLGLSGRDLVCNTLNISRFFAEPSRNIRKGYLDDKIKEGMSSLISGQTGVRGPLSRGPR